jgi:Holliday junction resolvase
VRGPGKTAEFIPYLIDDGSGVGTQIVAAPCSNKKFPDIVVGNKKGTFHLQHEVKKASKAEWETAQPKPAGQ